MKKLLLSLCLLAVAPAHASDMSVSPVTISAPDTSPTQTITLTNGGKTAINYQISAEVWTHVGDEITRTPAIMSEILVAPSMIELKPGAKRVIRISRMAPVDGKPHYYRVLMREIEDKAIKGGGVRLATDHSIPVAFEPVSAAPASLRVTRTEKGVRLFNAGGRVARITSIGTDPAKPWKSGAMGWLLPGGGHVYPFKAVGSSLTVTVNGKPVTLPIE